MRLDLALLGAGGVIAIVALRSVPGVWNGSGLATLNAWTRVYWVWGEASRRAFVRANVVAVLAYPWIIVGGFCATLLDSTPARPVRDLLYLGIVASVLVLVLFSVLLVTISFVNRPKFAVPPSLRGEDGMLTAWLKRRQASRRT